MPFNKDVVHQAVLRQQANARQGTASTKTRGDVAGSSCSVWPEGALGAGHGMAGGCVSSYHIRSCHTKTNDA
ncbi:MAG: 50S ribosomal protein L4 [Candidatus Sifarchaeia archaeon]